jgi:cell division septation protein DedD
MDKYLVEILKETNTIIIPGIGALTMTDRSSGEVMFMSFLKHDDGAFAKFIAEKEGLGIDEAKDKVASYVREIEAKLSAGESYDMPTFGSFRKDNAGDMMFEQNKGGVDGSTSVEVPAQMDEADLTVHEEEAAIEPELQAAVPESTSEETIIEETSMQETVVEPEELIVETETGADEAAIIEETPMQETVVEPELAQQIEESPIEVANTEKPVYTEEEQWNDDLDLPPVNATVERPKKPILEKAKADKKRRSPMLLFLIIAAVIVLGGATTVVLYGENLGLFMAKEEVKVQVQVEEELDEDKIDEWYDADETEDSEEEDGEEEDSEDEEAPVVKEAEPVVVEKKTVVVEKKPVPVEVKKVATVSSATNGAYHIVAGAFGDGSNAERLVTKLKGLGYSAQVLGQLNGLHIVSAGSYTSQQEAERALKENAANLPKAWVFNKQ